MLRWMTGCFFFQSHFVFMIARPLNNSFRPSNIARKVEIISDLPNLRGRARKYMRLCTSVASFTSHAVLSTYMHPN